MSLRRWIRDRALRSLRRAPITPSAAPITAPTVTRTAFFGKEEQCSYLPDQVRRMLYLEAAKEPAAWTRDVEQGFIHSWNHASAPRCLSCKACQALRVRALEFKPNRTQRRVLAANADLRVAVGKPRNPQNDPARLELLSRHHTRREDKRGWQPLDDGDVSAILQGFTVGPYDVSEWCFYLGDRLVGVSYTSHLTNGYLGRYYFYDPDYPDRSLGIFMCLTIIRAAAKRNLPYVYMGNYVAGCQSLRYKATFHPCEVRGADGQWREFTRSSA